MRRIDLDFAATRRMHRWAGPLLLAIAAAVCADMAFDFVRLSKSNADAERVVARSQPRKPVRAPSPEELALARDTLERLALPWGRLFAALEDAASDQVALLAIEPDPRTGKVVISGDSKDYLAALSYVLNLSRASALSDVQLVRHEVKANDPQHPVAFSISASWKEAKR